MLHGLLNKGGAPARRRAVCVARALAWLLILWLGSAGGAWAACSNPTAAHVASGGVAVFTCSPAGFLLVSQASHGVADADHGIPGNSNAMTYTNNGDGSTTDSFVAQDDRGQNITFQITIDPVASPLTITPSTLTGSTFGQAMSPVQLQTSGGTAPYTYTFTGTPPDGLSITSSGVISGTPAKAGSFSFGVHVVDSTSGTNKTGDQAYTITVALPTLTLAPGTLTSAVQNRPYSVTFSTTGGTSPYTYSLDSGTLPTGMTLNPATGLLSGTSSQVQNASFSIRVTDSTPSTGAHATVAQSYTLQVNAPPTITVTPPTLPNATHGVGYSQTLTAGGGTSPYTFSSTTLPAGLGLAPGGVLSGTPTAGGPATFTVTATDANNFTGSRFYSINVDPVAPGAPTIGSITAPAGGPSTPASVTVSFTGPSDNGGSAITGYTVTSSPGNVVATGAGSPITVPGLVRGTAYSFTVYATNSVNRGPDSAASGTITPKIIQTIVFANPGPQNFGTTPTLTASVDTNRPLLFSSSTPGVCTVNASSGQLTFPGAGNCSITVTQDGGDQSVYITATQTQSFQVNSTVPGPPTIGAVMAPDAAPGQSTGTASVSFTPPANNGGSAITGYTVTSSPGNITATGNASPIAVTGLTLGQAYTFTVTATTSAGTGSPSAASAAVTPVGAQTITFAKPADVNFGATSPLIATATSGLAVQFTTSTTNVCEVRNGNQIFGRAPGTCTVQASQPGDSQAYRAAAPVTQSFSIVVPGGAVTIATTSLPAPTRGTQYSQTIVAQNGAPPYTFVVVGGALPNNLSLNPGTGEVSGLVTGTGPYVFQVRVTDQAGQTAQQGYSFTVITPSLTFTPSTLPAGVFGSPYPSTTVSASGGVGAYTYAITAGSLPTGLTISSAGVISGTPTAAGTFNITITATDSLGYTGSQAYSIGVSAINPGVPVIGTATMVLAPAGQTTGSATVTFAAPASDGGSPITGYTVTSTPGGLTGTGAGTSITVSGLTLGTPYTFSVTATSGQGTSAPSGASNSVIPMGAQTIAFANPGTKDFGTTTPLVATSSSGLGVTLVSQTTNICDVLNGNQLTAKAPGNCTIHATQGGNGSYEPATPVDQSFSIVVPGGMPSFATTTLPAPTRGVNYQQTIVVTGGAPGYSFTVSAGSLPVGLTLNPSGNLSGVVRSTGPADFTVQVTDQAGQQATQRYQFTIISPTFTFTPATLPGGKVGVVYPATTVAAAGGIQPYRYTVTGGTLPAGLALSSAGSLTGTPTTAGVSPVTITATDDFGVTGTQAYTIAIGEATPVAADDTASVGANASVTIPVTVNDTAGGPITSIAIGQQPGHGTVTVNGLNAVYTPAHDYFGSDVFTYTATGPGGTSNAANVNVTVAAGPVPTITAQKATVLGGQSVTVHAAAGAGNGPFTTAAVVAQPSSGSVQVQGTDLVYTAAADASGDITFDYTLSNAFGTSQSARVTVTVNPAPVAPPVSAAAIAGRVVQVNLTSAARGGPFTGANVVSVSPSNAGATSIQASANGYVLTFTAAPTFGGTAQIGYTLTNAYATSAPGYVTVTVTPRSDPSKDPEVLGVLSAQADATRRMAVGQISNFQRRLEMLHSGGTSGFTNGITMSSAGMSRGRDAYADLRKAQDENSRRYLVQPNGDSPESLTAASSQHGTLPGDVSVWTGGAINFGKSQAGTSDNGTDFTTSGLSVGVDKQFNDKLAVGAGIGYGHDSSDVGNKGSHSAVDSYNVALYASYRPTTSFYTDALIGYQWLSFDSKRYVTDNGNRVNGSRDGKQWFASISAGYQMVGDNSQFTPYGRIDVARARLDGYTEHGDDVYSLKYQGQTVKTTTATVGVLAQWAVKRDYGVWAPQLRAEFGHDMQGSGQAVMRYADLLDGPLYRATLYRQSRNHTLLGAGIVLQTLGGWMLRAEYQNQLDNTTRDNQSILLGIEKKFGP